MANLLSTSAVASARRISGVGKANYLGTNPEPNIILFRPSHVPLDQSAARAAATREHGRLGGRGDLG